MKGVACFSLSIDLGTGGGSAAAGTSQLEAEARRQLLQLASRHQVPATWAVADPGQTGWVSVLENTSIGHEVALLADRSWVGPQVSPRQFVRELKLRIDRAIAAGITLETLALRHAELRDHAHLLAASGLRILRTAGSPSSRLAGTFATPTLRQGICRVPTTARIPARNSWTLRLADRGPVRLLRAAIAERAALHLTIDAELLAEGGSAAYRTIERLFSDAAAARAAGSLQIRTLSELARDLALGQPRRQAHSILRAA